MNFCRFFVVVAFICANCVSISAVSLPKTAMGMPVIFLKEEMSWCWEDVAAKCEWGELSDLPWRVYVDRDNVKAFTKPDTSASVNCECKFMDSYYVAKVENGYALLFSQSLPSMRITSNARACGWVSVDNLLLWSICPRTKNQVYKKALIVKDIDSEDYDEIVSSPDFSTSPFSLVPNGFRAMQSEIYFVFKETSSSALLFRGRSIDDNMLTERHGWMKRAEYTIWNTRLCLEPNFGEDVAGLHAAIFNDESAAYMFKEVGDSSDKGIVWKKKLEVKRSDPRLARFPILNVNSRYIFQVAILETYKGAQVNQDLIRTLHTKGLTNEDIEKLQKNGTAIKLSGYTSRISKNKEVFVNSVFITKTELDMLIRSLRSLNSNSGENQRLELQKALKSLALIYVGQVNDDMSIDDLMYAVNGLQRAMGGKSPLAGININDILDPNKVSQRLIDDFIKRIQEDIRKLSTLKNDKSCYFTSNNERYYYILLEDMPLQSER